MNQKSLYPNVKTDYVKDFRNYIDYYFEYNKANELICSQFICKQIYGNPELDAFIKNKFKTREQINFKWSLIPAYLALALTLGIAIWQKNDNSDIIKIQQQLDSIQQAIDNNNPDWGKIEQQLDDISKSDIYDGSVLSCVSHSPFCALPHILPLPVPDFSVPYPLQHWFHSCFLSCVYTPFLIFLFDFLFYGIKKQPEPFPCP